MFCSFSTIWCKIFNSDIWFSYMILNFFVLTRGTFSLGGHHVVDLVCNFTGPCISGLWNPWISLYTPSKFPQKRFLKVLYSQHFWKNVKEWKNFSPVISSSGNTSWDLKLKWAKVTQLKKRFEVSATLSQRISYLRTNKPPWALCT